MTNQCHFSVLAPRAGFEPATNRLTAGCSTAELPGKSLLGVVEAAYNKADPGLKAAAAATQPAAQSGLRGQDEPQKKTQIFEATREIEAAARCHGATVAGIRRNVPGFPFDAQLTRFHSN